MVDITLDELFTPEFNVLPLRDQVKAMRLLMHHDDKAFASLTRDNEQFQKWASTNVGYILANMDEITDELIAEGLLPPRRSFSIARGPFKNR
jgi:hypothetical protein